MAAGGRGTAPTARSGRWPVTVSDARCVELVADGADADAELLRRAADWVTDHPQVEVVGVDLGRSWLPAHTFLRLFVADDRPDAFTDRPG